MVRFAVIVCGWIVGRSHGFTTGHQTTRRTYKRLTAAKVTKPVAQAKPGMYRRWRWPYLSISKAGVRQLVLSLHDCRTRPRDGLGSGAARSLEARKAGYEPYRLKRQEVAPPDAQREKRWGWSKGDGRFARGVHARWRG